LETQLILAHSESAFSINECLGHVKLSHIFSFNSNKCSVMSPTELRMQCGRNWKFRTARS